MYLLGLLDFDHFVMYLLGLLDFDHFVMYLLGLLDFDHFEGPMLMLKLTKYSETMCTSV